MKKRLVALGLAVCMVAAGAVGCGTKKTEEKVETAKSSSTQKEEKKETELTKNFCLRTYKRNFVGTGICC